MGGLSLPTAKGRDVSGVRTVRGFGFCRNADFDNNVEVMNSVDASQNQTSFYLVSSE